MDPVLFDKIQVSQRKKIDKAIKSIQGLEGYWPLNETSGLTAFNQAPRTKGTNNGTNDQGTLVGQPGHKGKAFVFDGVNDRLGMGSICNYTDKVTLFGVFKIIGDANIGNFPPIWGKGAFSSYFLLFGNTRRPYMSIWDDVSEKGTNHTLQHQWELGKWYLLVGSYDKNAGANNISCYTYGQNVEKKVSNTITATMATNGLTLNVAYEQVRGYVMNIAAQHCGIVNRQMSDQEIRKLANVLGFL